MSGSTQALRHTAGNSRTVAEQRSRFGQLLAVVVAVAFAFQYAVIVAGSGLVVALVGFRAIYAVMRGIVFPVIEALCRVIAGER